MENICNSCAKLFKENAIINYSDFEFEHLNETICPISECDGYIIEPEENLFEAYKVLIRKGYKITDYCPAEITDSVYECMLFFDGDYDFDCVPKGFVINKENEEVNYEEKVTTILVKRYPDKLTGIELQKKVLRTAIDIINWSERLYRFSNNKHYRLPY